MAVPPADVGALRFVTRDLSCLHGVNRAHSTDFAVAHWLYGPRSNLSSGLWHTGGTEAHEKRQS